MVTDPGMLRHFLLIEQPTETKSATGHSAVSWTRFAGTWCRLTPRSGLEKVVADHIHAEASHVIEIPFIKGVSPKQRGVLGERIFQFKQTLNENEADRWIRLDVKELV